MKIWTPEEEEKLKSLYPYNTLSQLSEKLNRSRYSIAVKCNRLGLRGKGQPNAIIEKLSPEDKLWLKLNYPHMSNELCGIRLKCSWRTVVRIARKMGLEKSPQFKKECQAYTAKKAKESHLKNGTYPPKGWYSPNLRKGESYQFKKRSRC